MRERGLPLCRPQLLPAAERRWKRALYNLDLALRLSRQQPEGDLNEHIVSNDVAFDENGRIHILTGPNRGGKTTYIQAIGLLHVLAQSGMYVPAESASLSPVDGIYLHFPAEEKPNMESGRLGEEAGRLREIFRRATRHSLLLLNESLASTSATESYFLARDVVCCLRMLGARALFVTHLHELAADCESINSEVTGDSRVSQPDFARWKTARMACGAPIRSCRRRLAGSELRARNRPPIRHQLRAVRGAAGRAARRRDSKASPQRT